MIACDSRNFSVARFGFLEHVLASGDNDLRKKKVLTYFKSELDFLHVCSCFRLQQWDQHFKMVPHFCCISNTNPRQVHTAVAGHPAPPLVRCSRVTHGFRVCSRALARCATRNPCAPLRSLARLRWWGFRKFRKCFRNLPPPTNSRSSPITGGP